MSDGSVLRESCIPRELAEVLQACPRYVIARNTQQLADLAHADAVNGWHEVAYDVPGKGRVVEARVCRVRNGIGANYPEPYMRRRDPDCMVIADELPTDKPRYEERYGKSFDTLRQETFDWLKQQELAVLFFSAGAKTSGLHAVAVAPMNAGFFAFGLSLLQGIVDGENLPADFTPKLAMYIAPPFRHTHFDGRQMVVHNRLPDLHEMFSYNLYPGPSAKKGVYGALINLGESEEWVTAHCSTVEVVTPYDNKVTIMHEGASGGGKSEMLEYVHRETDGSLLLGENVVSGERRTLVLPKSCELRPVTDDMALCHPSLDRQDGKLALIDAESAWFVRVNHIKQYGVDPHLESLTVHAPKPLLFLNIEVSPNSTALIWEHIEDAPGRPCPNPRVVVPREIVPSVVNKPVRVDIRSFGVRTPPATQEHPSYGIVGLFHVLPPALAWLWRLVAPRGHDNPSIVDSETMSSEGVGSYWPFATGRKVDQANLLLRQIADTPSVNYILVPNQHIGAWRMGFMPQWLAREYLARRGGAWLSKSQVIEARCPLLGYALRMVTVEGQTIPTWLLQTELQREMQVGGYDAGAAQLTAFFHSELQQFQDDALLPLGRKIIDCCLSGGGVEDYVQVMGTGAMFQEE